MSNTHTTHIGLKIDTKPIDKLKKSLKVDSRDNVLTQTIAAISILGEKLEELSKLNLDKSVSRITKEASESIRVLDVLRKQYSKSVSQPRGSKRTAGRMEISGQGADIILASAQTTLKLIKILNQNAENEINKAHATLNKHADWLEKKEFRIKELETKMGNYHLGYHKEYSAIDKHGMTDTEYSLAKIKTDIANQKIRISNSEKELEINKAKLDVAQKLGELSPYPRKDVLDSMDFNLASIEHQKSVLDEYLAKEDEYAKKVNVERRQAVTDEERRRESEKRRAEMRKEMLETEKKIADIDEKREAYFERIADLERERELIKRDTSGLDKRLKEDESYTLEKDFLERLKIEKKETDELILSLSKEYKIRKQIYELEKSHPEADTRKEVLDTEKIELESVKERLMAEQASLATIRDRVENQKQVVAIEDGIIRKRKAAEKQREKDRKERERAEIRQQKIDESTRKKRNKETITRKEEEDALNILLEKRRDIEAEMFDLEYESHEHKLKSIELSQLGLQISQRKLKTLQAQRRRSGDPKYGKKEIKDITQDIVAQERYIKSQRDIIKNQKKMSDESKKFEKSTVSSVASMFSLEKIMSRMSFVLTAKLSYRMFDTFARIPKDAIRLWRELSDEMHKVFALIPQTSAVMKMQMKDTILRLSKTYGVAAKEMSGALYEIITAQVPLANAMQVLEAATRLSIAGAADLRSATQSLVRIANAYGDGFGSITRISDIAFQTIKYGQLTMQDYTDEMQKVIATAAIFNISQEEISAAVATMTRNGVGASRAFTSLNQMLMQIANPTREAIKLMDQLGISLTIRDIQEKGLGGALQEIMPLLNTADQHGRQLINILFKTRTGFQAVASLLQNMDQYGENYMHMLDSAGTSTEAFEERSKNLGFAVDRMKTAWDNMLLSVARLGDSEFTGIVDKTTGMIEKLSEQSHALYTVFLMIGGLIAAFVATSALRAIASLVTIRSTIQQLTTTMKVAGAAASAAWAKATMGLSLLIEAGIIAWRTFDKIRKDRAREYWEDFWGVGQARANLEAYSHEIRKLDERMSKLKGAEKMTRLWQDMHKKQNKTNQEIEQMESLFTKITGIMGDLNIKIDESGSNAETLGRYLSKIVEEMSALDSLISKTQMLKNIDEFKVSMLDWSAMNILDIETIEELLKNAKKDVAIYEKIVEGSDYPFEMDEKILESAKSMVAALSLEGDLVKTVGVSTPYIEQFSKTILPQIARYIREDDTENLKIYLDRNEKTISSLLDTFHDIKKDADWDKVPQSMLKNKETKKILGQTDANIQTLERMLTLIWSMQSGSVRLPDMGFDDWGGVEIGETAQKSFVDNLKSLLSPMLGTMIHLVPKTIKGEIQDKLNAIIKDIEEFEGEELDTAERQRIQDQLQEMLNTGVFAQVNTELVKSISELGKMAKSAYEMGNIDMAEEYMGRVVDVYLELENAIGKFSSNLDDIKNIFQDSRELDAISRTLEEMSLGAFTQYVNALTGDKRIQAIRETLLEKKEFKDLEELIQEAERAGETGIAELLKAVYDSTLTNMLNTLSDMLPDDLPKYAEDIISIMQDKMNKGLIEDEAGLRSVMKEWVDELSPEEQSAISEHLETIIDRIMGRKDDKLNWRNIFGIAEYETANDAVTDVAKKTVNTLTQVWDFYWDMELRKMQDQQDKKLKILEHEKDMMLANTNLSNEQRVVLEQRYQEEQERLREEFEKKSAKQKKKKAIYDATIDYAKGLISLWSASILNPIKAGVLSALLSGIFATQMAMINNQKFASGGFTGAGYGRPDETGHKPAGIVHAGELVFTKDMVDKNFAALSGLFSALRAGKSFDAYAMGHIAGSAPMIIKPSKSRSYASGGLVGGGLNNISISLGGIRTIDDVDLAKIVARGSKKMRFING